MTVSFQACTAPTEFTITGHIDGMPDSIKVVLADIEDPNGEIVNIAETYAIDGSFQLKGSVKSPKMCHLAFRRYSPKREGYGTVFTTRMMGENANIDISSSICFDSLANVYANERYISINGGKANKELSEYLNLVRDAEVNEREISYLGAVRYFESNADNDTVAKYDRLKKIASDNLLTLNRKFIADHPAYNISGYLTQKELEKLFAYTADEIDAMVKHVSLFT